MREIPPTFPLHSQLRNYALSLLAKKSFSREEFRQKLTNYLLRRKKEITQEIESSVRRVLKEMEEMGFLDDKEFADQFVRHSLSFRKRGIVTIRRELKRKGIEEEIIERILKDKEREEEEEAAVLIHKYRSRYEKMAERKDVRGREREAFLERKLREVLARRGFCQRTINKVLSKDDYGGE